MKKFLLFLFTIFFFTAVSLFVIEKTDLLSLKETEFKASFTHLADGSLKLSWNPLHYPCFYKIETFTDTTGLARPISKYHFFQSEFTSSSEYIVPRAAIPMSYRITAYGLFGRVAGPSERIPNPHYAKSIASPVPITRYSTDHPASRMPFLVWHTVPNAVCYEVELLSAPPEQEGGTMPADPSIRIFRTNQVFTNGYQADLRPYREYPQIYWRARALGLHHDPIGEFSKAEPLPIDDSLALPDRPLINKYDRMSHFKQPLYPVYEWIPLNDTRLRYEVELLVHPPAQPNNKEPSADRVWSQITSDLSSCYDEYARPYAGEYYWRVRAIDANGKTVGSYSDTEEFIVESQRTRPFAAIFGDSITHGGGAISYSPAALEYCYATYLDFPALNLGRSGDISHTTLARFDSDVLPFAPHNLLILTGSNSLRSEAIRSEDVINDLKELQALCEKNHIRPVLLTLLPIHPGNIQYAFHTETDPNWREKLKQINSYIRQQPYYIDLEPYFYDETHTVLAPNLAIDGLHPDIRGKMLMAEIINIYKDVLTDK